MALPGNAAGFALVTACSLASFIALGGLIAAVAATARVATGIGTAIAPVLWFCAGMWLPVAVMPAWLARVCGALPSGAAAQAYQELLQGRWPAASHLAVMLAWALGCALLAARLFRWE